MIILPILTTSLIHFSLKGSENVLFELGSDTVKMLAMVSDGVRVLPALFSFDALTFPALFSGWPALYCIFVLSASAPRRGVQTVEKSRLMCRIVPLIKYRFMDEISFRAIWTLWK